MKKLLMASSTLVVATPAMAEMTMSGTIAAVATTEDASKLTGSAITTLTLKATFDNGEGLGGTMTFGTTATGDISSTPLLDTTVYADTSYGKFSYSTNDGKKTDDDLVELGIIGDSTTKNVDVPGLAGFSNNGISTFLVYSNGFGDTDVALTVGAESPDAGTTFSQALSVQAVAAGFTFTLDSLSFTNDTDGTAPSTKTDAPMVINIVGDLGPVGIKLEDGYSAVTTDNDGTDLALSYGIGGVTVDYGFSTNGNDESDISELRLGLSANDVSYTVSSGTDQSLDSDKEDFSKFEVGVSLSGMDAGAISTDYNGSSKTELYVKPMSGIELEYVDDDAKTDPVINVKISASF